MIDPTRLTRREREVLRAALTHYGNLQSARAQRAGTVQTRDDAQWRWFLSEDLRRAVGDR